MPRVGFYFYRSIILFQKLPHLPDPEAGVSGFKSQQQLRARELVMEVEGRRGVNVVSDLRESHNRGLISRLPHYNSIFNYLEDDGLTPILCDLVRQSSLPLASVEVFCR